MYFTTGLSVNIIPFDCMYVFFDNRMGKTRDLSQKMRDTKGIFHTKVGIIEDIKGMDLIEADDIKNRWQEYTEELYKNDINDPDNHGVVITHLDILEYKVNWALGSITTNTENGGDEIPL